MEYILTISSADYFFLYSSIPETISAEFFENYEMLDPVYISRQLKSFPHVFTEDTIFAYSSVKFLSAFVVPEVGRYRFYITISKNSKVDLIINNDNFLTIDNTLFTTVKTGKDGVETTTKITWASSYLTSSWCLDTEQYETTDVSYTVGTPLYMQL